MNLHSHMMNRRQFSTLGAAVGGMIALPQPALRSLQAAKQKADNRHGTLRITNIEAHDISVPYADWISYQLQHFYGPTQRTVYVVHTNHDLIGLGEGAKEPVDVQEKYIGSNPFDWIGDETSLSLGTAMYDLMGRAAGVPVWKLFGQRYRHLVPVGSWTVSTQPQRMAEAVQQYSSQGYTWMKYHLSPFENVFDQLEAMQKVAPKGFKVLFDITMGGTNDHIPSLLEDMAAFPIAGAVEDPLNEKNIEGYIELRKRSRLPIVLHHSSQNFTFDVLRRSADAYILGHAKIGDAIRRAGLFAATDAPFMLQNVGGTITRAMTVHMQAAFQTASFPFHSDTETWKDDVTEQRLEPVNGLIRVPQGPGLGVTLDLEALERLKALELPQQPKWIIKTQFANGAMLYNLADPQQSIFMVRPDVRRLVPLSYAAPVSTEYWDDDGSNAYRQMFARLERDKVVLEKT